MGLNGFAMLKFIKRIFIWWEDSTLGTQWNTFLHGEKVGSDEEGNVYYRSKAKPGKAERRWVMYNGAIEASRISPDWHGWMHYTFDAPPTEEPLEAQNWEKEHQPNLTGSKDAYFPAGSPAAGGKRAAATGDYQAWQP